MSFKSQKKQKNVKHPIEKNGGFRRFASQFVATTVKNMLFFDNFLCVMFPTIIIPALTGLANEHNLNEKLSLNPVQTSWLGSIGYFCEPLGSITSVLIIDWLGRKRLMFLVNIPLTIAWFMMYNAGSVFEIFTATGLFGISIGLMDSPSVAYVGEICEPKYRSVMVAYTNISGTMAMSLVLVLNTLMPWRTVALVCMFLPIFTALALCFVPETPLWLLSQNRVSEAENALCWLRGWVSKEDVADEFHALQRYNQFSKSCSSCVKKEQTCTHPLPSIFEKLKELKRKSSYRPFIIVMSLFFVSEFTGMTAMLPFIVQIFKAYDSPVAPDQAAAIVSLMSNFANLTFMCLIRFPGKRWTYLIMLTGVVLCSGIVSVYGFIYLPKGYNSFDQSQTISMENQSLAYIPFVCIILWSFCYFCAVNTLPWQLLSEVFPFKVRGTLAALSATLDYFFCFASIKTYYDWETSMSMPGYSLLCCFISVIGLVSIYFILPETENRTLEEIELHFSDKSKKITDRNIAKIHSEPKKDLENGNKNGNTGKKVVENEKNLVANQNGSNNLAFVNDEQR